MHSKDRAREAGARSGSIASYVRDRAFLSLVSGIGGGLAIFCLSLGTETLSQLLLIAPFGASCVLLFALPHSPLARPRNVIGGHLLSALSGFIVIAAIGNGGAIACALAVGLAIAVMQFTDTLHPPAGGTPLVILFTGAGWSFLLLPVFAGTVLLVVLAWLYHRFISSRPYPV